MRQLACRLLHDDDLAADAVQETLTRLWHRRHRLGRTSNPMGFCMTSLRNYCIDLLRQQKHYTDLNQYGADIADSDTDSADTEARYQCLERGIATLNEQQRELIRLRYVERLSGREIAQIKGLTEGYVNTILSRAYDKLRKYMTEQQESI